MMSLIAVSCWCCYLANKASWS